MRVAAIDVGANSVKLLVAEVAGGHLEEVERWGLVTRLAGGAAAGGRIDASAIEATREALAHCRQRSRVLGAARLVAAATGGLRLAPDGPAIAADLGQPIGGLQILPPETEACLSVLGIRAGCGWPASLIATDVGGASTEVVRLEAGVVEAWSAPIGAVTLTERCLPSDPPLPEELAAAAAEIAEKLVNLKNGKPLPGEVLGAGGAFSTLGLVARGARHVADIHGARLDVDELRTLFATLAGVDAETRRRKFRISEKRADITVAGCAIIVGLTERLGCRVVRLSTWGVRHGLALAVATFGRLPVDLEDARAMAAADPPIRDRRVDRGAADA